LQQKAALGIGASKAAKNNDGWRALYDERALPRRVDERIAGDGFVKTFCMHAEIKKNNGKNKQQRKIYNVLEKHQQ
jgi:hypothetical protein